MKTYYLVLVAGILVLMSCTKTITGRGDTLSEDRQVPSFSGVRLEGDGELNIEQSSDQRVTVTGYGNLLPIYETFVQNDILFLKFKDEYHNIRHNNIKVSITVPVLQSLAINGSGKIMMQNFLAGNALSAMINGSGDVYIANSIYNTANLEINGSGYIHAETLKVNNAENIIHGSGSIDINCSQKLKVRIYGSGWVNYWGSPTELDTEISGNGHIIKK